MGSTFGACLRASNVFFRVSKTQLTHIDGIFGLRFHDIPHYLILKVDLFQECQDYPP